MKITRLTAVGILASFMLISCSSIAPLSEEEAALLVEGTVFEPDETEKTVYVPVETVRYIVTDSNNSDRIENDSSTDIMEDATVELQVVKRNGKKVGCLDKDAYICRLM